MKEALEDPMEAASRTATDRTGGESQFQSGATILIVFQENTAGIEKIQKKIIKAQLYKLGRKHDMLHDKVYNSNCFVISKY